MSMKRLAVIGAMILALVMGVCARAEERGVPFNGVILDGDRQPVKKVRVYTFDRNYYATSDKQGRFGLTDVAPTDTLTLLVGKKTVVRIPVEGRKSMRIILGDDYTMRSAVEDDSLVNLGYGYVKRREYTGSGSGISGELLRRSGATNLLQALAGKVAGLTVTPDGQVQMRGQRSLLFSSQPLFMVDGMEVETLDNVNVYDVDHVEVLKSAPQYGMRGANGAILVTTISFGNKKGRR